MDREGQTTGADDGGARWREALLDRLAAERAGGAASLGLAWRQGLALLPEMGEGDLERLARALPGPAGARQLARLLAREADAAASVARFLGEVDESEETLEAWLEAFGVLAERLEGTAHRPGFSQALGYLHCCAAVVGSGARHTSLPLTVTTMLETYGFNPSG